jgi:hypothetical protein
MQSDNILLVTSMTTSASIFDVKEHTFIDLFCWIKFNTLINIAEFYIKFLRYMNAL